MLKENFLEFDRQWFPLSLTIDTMGNRTKNIRRYGGKNAV
jgi:hypothetical protein